ncbi:MAG: hypothetical protein A2148_03270 [Chloroflexi bacterium RBG_16_68_14]|nr:MAG: hypothetical protein A2148_03270 [Chloroflexi bacterium RBG_16_68_14]
MNLDALPYTVLLILAEFSVGSLVAVLIADGRGLVVAAYVKLSAAIIVAGAALTLLAAFNVSGAEFEGYRLEEGLFGPARGAFAAFLALSALYAAFALGGPRRLSLPAGGLAAAAGLVGLGLLAYQVSPPTWGFAGPLLSLLAGALALGLVSEAMVLGHWYLVSPRLPGRPLQEMTFLLLAVLVVQAALLVLNAAVPAREAPESTALLAGGLGANPAFWLRVGVGLLFPIALAYMAWRSSLERAMMSATGLLYIAVGAVFVGELLARGLLFVTAAPV